MESYSLKYSSAFDALIRKSQFSQKGSDVGQQEGLDLLCALTGATAEKSGRFIFVGNGASASFASHMALDWSKNGGVASLCLSDGTQLTALGNDLGYEEVFSAPLDWHGKENDVLVTISSSGNSENIVRSIRKAHELGLEVVSFSGLKPDNMSRQLADYSLYVPGLTYGMVECAHQLWMHMWLDCYMNVMEWDRDGCQNMSTSEFSL